jgi:putative ABC transport system substrate-binding protein
MIQRRTLAWAGAGVLAGGMHGGLRAQPSRRRRIANISHSVPLAAMAGSDPASPAVRGLIHGLRALGLTEGEQFVIDRWSAEGRLDRSGPLSSEVLSSAPDVIVVFGPVLRRALQQATDSIPIVAVGGGPDMGAANLARPGGNVTGLLTDAGFGALNGKRLDLLKQAAPQAARVVAIRPPPPAGQPVWPPETEQAASKLGVTLSVAVADNADAFDSAFAAIVRDRAQAMLIVDSPANVASLRRIVTFAAQEKLPAIYGQRIFAEAGGLMSYGADLVGLSRRAAAYVHKILAGAAPGDLPIEQPTRFELIVNRRTGQAIGLTLSRALLLQADEVIE